MIWKATFYTSLWALRIIFLLTGFLLICQAEEPSGRDSQLDSNCDVALKHNEQHQTKADHIVKLPDQVDHIGQHQENETKKGLKLEFCDQKYLFF